MNRGDPELTAEAYMNSPSKKVRECPIHPKKGKYIYLNLQKIWKLKCNECYSFINQTEDRK